MDSRLDALKAKWRKNEHKVHAIGIYGMSGIGKTEISMALYNQLFLEFDASVFLEVDDNTSVVDLQKQLLEDIFGAEESFKSVAKGKSLIDQRQQTKRVLVILDGLHDIYDHLKGLPDRRWFKDGSLIVITTTDKQVLNSYGVEEGELYEPPGELNVDQSLVLFKKYAFQGKEDKEVDQEFIRIAKEIVEVTPRLPLAIEVFGKHFGGLEMSEDEWRPELKYLRKHQHKKIHERLKKIAYDRLDGPHQTVFLDIACFLIGKDMDYAAYIWDESVSASINLLVRKSLLKLNNKNQFFMHDLLRDMGHEIVIKERADGWYKSSRLWRSDDILSYVFSVNKVPIENLLRGIMFRQGTHEEQNPRCNSQIMKNMLDLRLFDLEGVTIEGQCKINAPNKLKWLGLTSCKFEPQSPLEVMTRKVAILDLSGSDVSELLLDDKAGGELKILNLSSTALTKMPDLSKNTSLVQLRLSFCKHLRAVHESIDKLGTLKHLDMEGCDMIEQIPPAIWHLNCLEKLFLGWCTNLSSLPEAKEDFHMSPLKELSLNNTGLRKLPDSIEKLTKLSKLSLHQCKYLKMLPTSFKHLGSLQKVTVVGTQFNGVNNAIKDLMNIIELKITSLELLSVLPDAACKRILELHIVDPEKLRKKDEGLFSWSEKEENVLGRLENLEMLTLNLDMLPSLPQQIGTIFRNLQTLNLECGNLKSLPESIGKLKKLKTLLVKSGAISDLPPWLWSLEKVEVLGLKLSNKDVSIVIPDLVEGLGNLESLEVICKTLGHVSSIKNLGKLKKLTLKTLHVKSLPDLMPWCLRELEQLSLGGSEELKNAIMEELKRPSTVSEKLRVLSTDDGATETSFWF